MNYRFLGGGTYRFMSIYSDGNDKFDKNKGKSKRKSKEFRVENKRQSTKSDRKL